MQKSRTQIKTETELSKVNIVVTGDKANSLQCIVIQK